VTLLVTPDQALNLNLGMNKGLLHLSLRNSEDDSVAVTTPATMAELPFLQEKPTRVPSLTGPDDDVVATAYNSPVDQPGSMEPSRPRYGEIRTFRGSNQGNIRIQF
jgi:hypothetical protein